MGEEKDTEQSPTELFKGVTYYVVGDISDEVTCLLEKYGAKRDSYLSEMVSHVIADSTTPDDYSEAKELFELPIVTSDWVLLSVRCGKQLPKEVFFLEGRLFSGVVACPWELDPEDILNVWGMIVYHGGKCQLNLDKNVTHLVTASLEGTKFDKAKEHSDQIKIVTPDWITDSITKKERQDEEMYHSELVEYPKPKPPTPPPLPETEIKQEIDTEHELFGMRGGGFDSGLMPSSLSTPMAMHPDLIDNMTPQERAQLFHSGVARQYAMDDNQRIDIPRPDTPSAKEALARKLTSRIQGKASSEPTTPERPSGPPGLHRASSPGAATGMRVLSPLPGMGLHHNNIRNTLRNITNRSASAQGMPMRPSTMMPGAPKINQMSPMGIPPRGPPPEYSLPPRSAAPLQPTLSMQQQQPTLSMQQQQQQPPPPPPSHAQVQGPTPVPAVPGSAPPPPVSGPMNPTQFPPQPGVPAYFGHDPKENVPPELCLLSCIFCIVDYQNILGSEEIAAWKKVIEQFGGQVESSYCYRVTHVLCANQKSDVFKMALKEGKRVVSAFWLNDCLTQKKMVPPWQALHLPLSFNSEKPGFNQMISVTNFDGEERVRLKQMINSIGAKYTGYMTRHNSALICKKPGGMKFEKAKEWRIAVVNVQWLSDLVLGNMDALRLPVHVRYLQVGQGREFHMDLTRVLHLMGGWKTSVKIHKDTWKKIAAGILAPVGQENSQANGPSPPKRQKVNVDSSPPECDLGKPRVLFTIYPKTIVSRLETIVRKLGGAVVSNPKHCTHLVTPNLARTIKFFVAVNCCHFIVTKDWLEESLGQNKFVDEVPFALKDEKSETALGCNLLESVRRARTKPLFQGFSFYLSPSVVPPVCELTSIVETAGGVVLKKRPSRKQILASTDEKGHSKIIIITCLNDLHLTQDLRLRKIPVYNAEFILTGVMRQDVDFNIFRITAVP